jgi:hypothetical protein
MGTTRAEPLFFRLEIESLRRCEPAAEASFMFSAIKLHSFNRHDLISCHSISDIEGRAMAAHFAMPLMDGLPPALMKPRWRKALITAVLGRRLSD